MTSDERRGLRPYRLAVLIGFVVLVSILVIGFRTTILPFVVALFLTYLLEPVVARLVRLKIRSFLLPRWVAVVVVYLCFGLIVTFFSVVVLPNLSRELGKLVQLAPSFIMDLKTEVVPDINRKINSLLREYSPPPPEAAQAESLVVEAGEVSFPELLKLAAEGRMDRVEVEGNRYRAYLGQEGVATAWGPPEADLSHLGLAVKVISKGPPQRPSALRARLTENDRGEITMDLEDLNLQVRQIKEDQYQISARAASERHEDHMSLDIEALVNDSLSRVVEGTASHITSLLNLGQSLVRGVITTFVTFGLTLMIAAFILMDLDRVLAFFRSLVPSPMQTDYDVLVRRLDQGLSGVIRGQITICLVNGVLTAIGLHIIGVKFATTLSVLAAVMSLIPIFGTIISSVPIVGIGLTQSFTTGLLALSWIVGIHLVEANLLNPKIIGKAARIHPVIVIFALLAGEQAHGLVGALVAVPIASIVQTLFLFVRNKAYQFEP